jgi:predicted O-methyltransferase YrrM
LRQSAITLEPEISDAEMQMLLSHLKRDQLRGRHLEIGTAAGGTLREMTRSYPAETRPPFVVIDPMKYFPDQLAIVRKNVASAGVDPDSIDFRITTSWPAFHAAERAGERYSFMFIDGSHKVHRVTQDLSWTRLLDTGGLLFMHDYSERMVGVTAAVDRFLAKYPNYKLIEHVGHMIAIRKTAPSATPEISFFDRVWANVTNLRHQLAASAAKRSHG